MTRGDGEPAAVRPSFVARRARQWGEVTLIVGIGPDGRPRGRVTRPCRQYDELAPRRRGTSAWREVPTAIARAEAAAAASGLPLAAIDEQGIWDAAWGDLVRADGG